MKNENRRGTGTLQRLGYGFRFNRIAGSHDQHFAIKPQSCKLLESGVFAGSGEHPNRRSRSPSGLRGAFRIAITRGIKT
jgi:hypothetical protein